MASKSNENIIQRRSFHLSFHGGEMTKQIMTAFQACGSDMVFFEHCSKIKAYLEAPEAMEVERRQVGKPKTWSDVELAYVWLGVERNAIKDGAEWGRRNVDRTIKKMFERNQGWDVNAGGKLITIKCASSARRLHAQASRRIKRNERSRNFWGKALKWAAVRDLREYPNREALLHRLFPLK